MMLDQEGALVMTDGPASHAAEIVVVETRFGIYEFTPDNTIIMPQGLIGFPEHQQFGLANLPAPSPEDFKLFQSLGEPPVSFIVMPLSCDEAPLDTADIAEICSGIGSEQDDAYLLFICTIRPNAEGQGIDMTVNLRAPIVFDMKTRQGRQFVLQNERYSLNQPVDKWSEVG
jgi:flagellar assembly factor FliW